MNKSLVLAVATALLAGAPAIAADHVHGHKMNITSPMTDTMHGEGIMIESPWARASVGQNGAAYFTVANRGKTDVKLVGVSADVARHAGLHTHRMDGEIMRMRPLENLVVPAGTSVTLKPGGHHVMLMGLTHKLKEGEVFPLTVIFEKAGKMQVNVKIGKIGAAGPMGDMKRMDGHSHQNMKH